MHRVLIVDDEEPVLDSYSYLLESVEGFVLAGKARSGFEALNAIGELKPDVVFMDINIPGMDGIDVIAEVHDKFPHTVFILSTAYERFDMAQRAIPLGVFAYLVKPVTKRTFLETLETVRAHLKKSGIGDQAMDEETEIRRFLAAAARGRMTDDEWASHRERFALHSDKGVFLLAEIEENQEGWCRTIAEKLSYRHRCLCSQHMNRGLFLILGDADRTALVAEAEGIAKELLPPDVFRAIAAGRVRQGTELYLSCREAMEDLKTRRNTEETRLRQRARIGQLRRKIGIAPIEELRPSFASLWTETFAAYDAAVAKARIAVFFSLLLDDLAATDGAEGAPPADFDPVEDIFSIPDPAELEAWGIQTLESLHGSFYARRNNAWPFPLAKAVEIINEGYAGQLQLSDVAESARVSAAYLSRLFSERMRTTFVDYLTELRVDKAEKLIRDTRMSIKEIAYSVGYRDPNYFGKIFRKVAGLTPTAYAERARRKAENDGENALV